MYSRLRERFGTASLILSIIGIVAVLGGVALASGGLTKAQEKRVKAIAKQVAKQLQGTGPAGAAGPQGAVGPAGPRGPEGPQGPEGPKCSPWVPGTLPSEAMEVGAWTMDNIGAGTMEMTVPVSFPIPLTAANAGALTFHVIKVGETAPTGCTGGTAANPKASPGNFCFYIGFTENSLSETAFQFYKLDNSAGGNVGAGAAASPAGLLLYQPSVPTLGVGGGSYAVTAP